MREKHLITRSKKVGSSVPRRDKCFGDGNYVSMDANVKEMPNRSVLTGNHVGLSMYGETNPVAIATLEDTIYFVDFGGAKLKGPSCQLWRLSVRFRSVNIYEGCRS